MWVPKLHKYIKLHRRCILEAVEVNQGKYQLSLKINGAARSHIADAT